MTEYDYSPEAYERYLSKQRAISRWVDEANQHAPANPFLPSEAPTPRNATRAWDAPERNYDSDSDYGRSSASRHRRHHDRDERHRSHRKDSHRSHSSKKRSRSSSMPSSPSYTHYTSPYTSQPTNRYPYPYSSGYNQPQQYPSNYMTNVKPYTYPSGSSTTTPLSTPQAYTPPPGQLQPTVVPIGGGAGGYVVVPPPGVSYQVVYPSPSQTQPWYKRVFSPTPSTGSGRDKLTKSSSSASHKKRSSRKWNWDIY